MMISCGLGVGDIGGLVILSWPAERQFVDHDVSLEVCKYGGEGGERPERELAEGIGRGLIGGEDEPGAEHREQAGQGQNDALLIHYDSPCRHIGGSSSSACSISPNATLRASSGERMYVTQSWSSSLS